MTGALHGVMLGMSPYLVTISGETITGSTGGGGTAFVSFESDGTVDKNVNGTVSQIDAATDWVIPNSAAPNYDFEIRFTQDSGDAPSTGTLNTWQALTVDRTIGYSSEVSAKSGVFTAEIRDAADNIIASGQYTCTVTGA